MARSKWEYCVVKYGHDTLGNAVTVFFADSVTLKYKGNEDELARVLTQLGSEGWETTGGGGSQDGKGAFMIWVLKRSA